MRNYHEVLGVPDDADSFTIKKAYRDLAKKYHPDHNHDPSANDNFIRVTEAYEYLIGKTPNEVKFNNDFFSGYSYESEVKAKAREYARMRYEKFVRRSTAYDRLSIHKVFWGKEITYLLLILSLIVLTDFFSPAVIETVPVTKLKIIRSVKSHAINLKISTADFSFYANDEHSSSDIGTTFIRVKHTPYFGFVDAYWLAKDQYKIKYEPDQKVSDYILFPFVVFGLSLITLTYRFKTFENKLMIKMVTIIAVVCFLTIYFVFK